MHVDTGSQRLNADKKFPEWAWSKNGRGQSGHRSVKLTVSQK